MKNLIHLFLVSIIFFSGACNRAPETYNLERIYKTPTTTKEIYFNKLRSFFGEDLFIRDIESLSIKLLIGKFEEYLDTYQTKKSLSDDAFVLASVEEALNALKDGEYGIGAVLVKNDKIILRAHNSQLSKLRSDLHAEMTLLNKFELNENLNIYRNLFNIDNDITLYSSTEPCPMCLIRIVTCELKSKYGASSDLDGMAHLIKHLPKSWRELAMKNTPEEALASDELKALAHLMFYSFLVMD